ncbi:phospholipase B-like 1 isoform X2 [Nerophis lumbriciformis]|uniref:phospholipase B-like 1 isoform X2 n=1 Tax=Nerophis lumbriciformis TaxID=546530 RepID=UPI002ADFB2DB|nr:phospholipase B-like 1 isoform X2 [Nerophis lumbriciformis]
MKEHLAKLWILFNTLAASGHTWRLHEATVYWDAAQKRVILKEDVMETEGGAYGYFNDTLHLTGWGILEICAGFGNVQQEDETTFFLAGYLEGYFTAKQMFNHYSNVYPQLIKDEKVLNPLESFLSEQDQWAREQVKLRKNSEPLWNYLGLILAQLDGLIAGAASWAKSKHTEPLSVFTVQFLNSVGDLLDLVPALTPRLNSAGPKSFSIQGMGHCTALIKVTPGFENLLLGHSSWYNYASTMRIYKHWNLRVSNMHVATGKMSFSSYPGFLTSLDDFYLLGSRLLVTQTSIGVFNASLFSQLSPHSLLAWQRVRLANSLARSGEEWVQIFSKYNSGTYNSQYMVVDLSKISLGHSIRTGALTVVEQIPGKVMHSDQTQTLRGGYWPSYNIPFHVEIYNLSGYSVMWTKHGEDFSYDLCARAKILRRDQAKVFDLRSLKYIMRYNNYRRDPYAKGHPCKTICCRNDLRPRRPRPGGCYDTKVTDYQMALQLAAEAINGPTIQGGLRPFTWLSFNLTAHDGLPNKYNFTFITVRPALHKP